MASFPIVLLIWVLNLCTFISAYPNLGDNNNDKIDNDDVNISERLIHASSASLASSLYGPHRHDGDRFFEGWYTRATCPFDSSSVGFIIGTYPNQTTKAPSNLISILYQEHTQSKLQTFDFHPSSIDIQESASKEQFNISIPSIGSWKVTPDLFELELTIPVENLDGIDDSQHHLRQKQEQKSVKLRMVSHTIVPWGKGLFGVSPEGPASILPLLGLHWFVYSLGSNTYFSLTLPDGKTINRYAYAHQEKNWGKAFPSDWIWVQGLQSKERQLVLVSGKIPVGVIDVPASLIKYKSSTLGSGWTFSTVNLQSVTISHDSEKGTVKAITETTHKRLEIEIKANRDTFSPVSCPTEEGFKYTSEESFAGIASIRAYERSFFFTSFKLVEETQIYGVAVEFGGSFSKL